MTRLGKNFRLDPGFMCAGKIKIVNQKVLNNVKKSSGGETGKGEKLFNKFFLYKN